MYTNSKRKNLIIMKLILKFFLKNRIVKFIKNNSV